MEPDKFNHILLIMWFLSSFTVCDLCGSCQVLPRVRATYYVEPDKFYRTLLIMLDLDKFYCMLLILWILSLTAYYLFRESCQVLPHVTYYVEPVTF